MTYWFVGPSVIGELMVAEALSWRVFRSCQPESGKVPPTIDARPTRHRTKRVKPWEKPVHV